jgi:hypothetical protein
MIIASGITGGAIATVVALFMLMAGVLHLLLLLICKRIFHSFFKNLPGNGLLFWMVQMGLFILTCFLLAAILNLNYYLTGKGLLQ